jgi:hypothetical protein
MKKLIGFISVAIIVLMAACSKDAPGPIVEKAMNDMINGNYEAFINACDCGEDSLPADQVKQAKQMAVSMLEKTMKGVKEGTDEEAKKKLPKSCKVLDEKIDGDNAVVELEITSEGGETNNAKIQLKKNKAGEWKISNSNDIMPSAPAPAVDEAEDTAEEAVEDAEEAAEDVADATEEEAPEAEAEAAPEE